MLIRRALALFALVGFLSACNLRRPEVTLTLAPIDTSTPDATDVEELPRETKEATTSPTPTPTVTLTLSPTDTPSVTGTVTPTDAPSPTKTDTPTETETPSATATPTATDTLTATYTQTPASTDISSATDTAEPPPTFTLTATDAPTPTSTLTATATLTAIETDRPTPTRIVFETATPTNTPPVSLPQLVESATSTATSTEGPESPVPAISTFTPLPTLNQTEVAKLLATPLPRPTLPPTWTAAPTLPPTGTIVASPESTAPVDASVSIIGPVILSSPIVATPLSQLDARTSTPTPSATPFQPTVAVRSDLLQPAIEPPISQPTAFAITGASAFQYDVGLGQVFTFGDIRLDGGVRLFLQNPVDPGSFLRTDYKGMLRYKPIGVGQEGEMSYSPFHFGFSGGISSIDQNKNRIVELDWSADGTRFSFRIDPPPGTNNASAGVWFWQPATNLETDPTYPIIRDCVREDYLPCDLVSRSGPWHWQTIAVQWSPRRGDNSVLLTLRLTDEGRNGLSIAQAVRDPFYANAQQPVVRYDYGAWNPDGQSITVSGRRPDGRVIIGLVNRNLQGEQLILDGSARGLWLRDAVRRPNGQYLALGRPGGPGGGPVALYDQYGDQLSDFIGGAAPEDIRWFPDRSAVVVAVQGQQYTVDAESGIVSNYSGLVRNPQFGRETAGDSLIPQAVVIGSEYVPGEQLRVINEGLNIRQEPSTSSGIVGRLRSGDYVAIFAGPYENEGYRWWRVQTANGNFGWIAGAINGAPTLRRP
ncbi:MAG: SH3 domain-containing protein [Chloroflexi bacterium]|nr:SH3 domain-containing protein [Chloroflexota bacterium]